MASKVLDEETARAQASAEKETDDIMQDIERIKKDKASADEEIHEAL